MLAATAHCVRPRLPRTPAELPGVGHAWTGKRCVVFVGRGAGALNVGLLSIMACPPAHTWHGSALLHHVQLLCCWRAELSVREHMNMVLRKLQGQRFVEFESLFDVHQGTSVLVVTFVALLELAKEMLVEITQGEVYAPIYVRLAYTSVH